MKLQNQCIKQSQLHCDWAKENKYFNCRAEESYFIYFKLVQTVHERKNTFLQNIAEI